MRLLILSFYFEPDLCAGSFRASALVKKFKEKNIKNLKIDVLTTIPNRYASYKVETKTYEKWNDNINIYRFYIPNHKNGFKDQAVSFMSYAKQVLYFLKKSEKYDLTFATSSRLFTASLGAYISKKYKVPLFLDIRDIFYDTMFELFKKSPLRIILPFIKILEKFTFKKAIHINLVSEGFKNYFQKINNNVEYTYYTNGIDDIFLNYNFEKTKKTKKKIITYAGNIGKGQALEKIIPQIALFLGEEYEIRIIGDGGMKKSLEQTISNMNLNNVKLFLPVNRNKLLKFYKETDYLFLHLDDIDAFKKVLPSKIFEYAATGKTIIAGVNGYAKKFIIQNIPHSIIFEPGNIENFKINFSNTIVRNEHNNFIEKYNRNAIMEKLTDEIISQLN